MMKKRLAIIKLEQILGGTCEKISNNNNNNFTRKLPLWL